MFDEQID
jgi:hypothetical protein